VFKKSKAKVNGKHIKHHFDRWGWINFLKSIASTKVFDIPGSNMNSIQCARKARAFDVLVYASEDKTYNEAQALDHEEEMKRIKK
jgi:hypothetical protein